MENEIAIARLVVDLRFVNMEEEKITAETVMGLYFVIMEEEKIIAKYVLILLNWVLEIGYTIVEETIRSMTDMIQIISLINISLYQSHYSS